MRESKEIVRHKRERERMRDRECWSKRGKTLLLRMKGERFAEAEEERFNFQLKKADNVMPLTLQKPCSTACCTLDCLLVV